MSDRFVAYLILVEGYIRILPGWKIKIYSFKEALNFMQVKTVYMIVFLFCVPFIQVFQYLAEEFLDKEVNFKISLILNILIISMGLCSVVFIIGLATNFKKTLNFESFRAQLIPINLMQGSYTITGSLLKVIKIEYEGYSKHESYIDSYMLILCNSCFFCSYVQL